MWLPRCYSLDQLICLLFAELPPVIPTGVSFALNIVMLCYIVLYRRSEIKTLTVPKSFAFDTKMKPFSI